MPRAPPVTTTTFPEYRGTAAIPSWFGSSPAPSQPLSTSRVPRSSGTRYTGCALKGCPWEGCSHEGHTPGRTGQALLPQTWRLGPSPYFSDPGIPTLTILLQTQGPNPRPPHQIVSRPLRAGTFSSDHHAPAASLRPNVLIAGSQLSHLVNPKHGK